MRLVFSKKIFIAVVVLLLAFAFCACDGSNEEISATANVSASATASVSSPGSSSSPSATPAKETTEETAKETGLTPTPSSDSSATAPGDNTPEVPTPTAENTAEPDIPSVNAKYCVRRAFSDKSTEIGKYDTLEEAKLMANVNAHTGYVVFDMDGNFIYSRYSNKVTALLCHAKKISDLIVENGFQLGTPTKNPAVDNSELLINGDSYVGWVLYNCGYSEGQPSEGGLKLNKPGSEGNLADFCAAQGFEKVTNINDLKAGDIVFYGEVDGIEGFAGGVSILASDAFEDDTNYIYDYCYNLRMEEMQPMRESVVDFMFAYRIG